MGTFVYVIQAVVKLVSSDAISLKLAEPIENGDILHKTEALFERAPNSKVTN